MDDFYSAPRAREPYVFRVTDLKQYTYCPRILYYHTVLPAVRPVTYKMEDGILAHGEAAGREKRRKLRTYGLESGERHFNVPVISAELGLSGEVDMVIETPDELIPVDYKQSRRIGSHFKLQLMAYGRLLEVTQADAGKAVRRGFIYQLPQRKAVEIRFTKHLRRKLDAALAELQAIVSAQHVPAAATQRRRCVDCEFRRFCNDVL